MDSTTEAQADPTGGTRRCSCGAALIGQRIKAGTCGPCGYRAKEARRRERMPATTEPRTPEQVRDIDRAMAELATARAELLDVPEGLSRAQRRKLTLEPMSRLELAVRFIEDVMRRNGWERTP